MAYTLKYTNGKILTTLPDQTSDSVSTSLTLIGKNVNAYGTDINQNYIHLLENFANSTDKSPRSPLVGQMWFDTTTQQIKVYVPTSNSSGEFKPVGSPKIAPAKPLTIQPGDFWYDSNAQQLKFQADASSDPVVIGPAYDASVGRSGWVNETYTADDNSTQTVLSLYANDMLLGIVSDVAFNINTTATTTTNMSSIGVGFNANTKDNIAVKWHGTATSAEVLVDYSGTEFGPADFYRNGVEIFTTGTIRVQQNEYPLRLGKNDDFQFTAEIDPTGNPDIATTATLKIGGVNENFSLKMTSTRIPAGTPVIHVDSANGVIGFFTDNPTKTINVLPDEPDLAVSMNIVGNVVVDGDLVVNGATNYVKVQDLLVRDKTIELNWDEAPGTATLGGADGGGIRLSVPYPANIRSITWRNASQITAGVTDVWAFDTNVEIVPNGTFGIGGNVVLTKDTLGLAVKSAPGLTSIGALTTATIGGLTFTSQSTGSYSTSTIGGLASNTVIKIGDARTAWVDFSNRRLTNIAQPDINDELVFLPDGITTVYDSSVATVRFVKDNANLARNPKIGFTIDVTGHAESPLDPNLDVFVLQMLTMLYNPNEVDPSTGLRDSVYATPDNSRAKVLCVRYTTAFQPPNDVVVSDPIDLGLPVTVDKGGVQDSATVVEYNPFIVARIQLPQSALIGVNRCIKQYYVSGGIWLVLPTTPGGDNLVYTDGTW